MKHSRTTLTAGFSLALVFLFFTGANWLLCDVSQNEYSLQVFVELFAFLIPLVLMLLFRKDEPLSLRLKRFDGKAFGFVIKASFAVSFLSFLLNYLTSFIIGIYQDVSSVSDALTVKSEDGILIILISIAFIPAFVEELYMRGAFFSSYERLGTKTAIFMSAFSFALIHSSADNFFGPFAAGCLYAYLTYTLESIWPAVISHAFNNLYSLLMNTLMLRYSAFGIWTYFLVLNLFCFLIFAFLSLSALEKLIRKGKIKKFQKGSRNFPASLFETILSPGFLLFMFLFISRALFQALSV